MTFWYKYIPILVCAALLSNVVHAQSVIVPHTYEKLMTQDDGI